jgi:hypothetical protein
VKKFFLILLPVLKSEFCFVLGVGGMKGEMACDLQAISPGKTQQIIEQSKPHLLGMDLTEEHVKI